MAVRCRAPLSLLVQRIAAEAAAGPGVPRPTRRTASARRSARLRRATATRCSRRSTRASAESFPASDSPARTTAATARRARRTGRRAHGERRAGRRTRRPVSLDGQEFEVDHGAVVIAAITSCTNTSNPSVMIGAALLAKKAVEQGPDHASRGSRPRWRPGSKVVIGLLRAGRPHAVPRQARLQPRRLRLHDLHRQLRPADPGASARRVNDNDLAVVSVLSGNRNFEGRINPDVKMNYLASPPLVVAYALAGSMDVDLTTEPLGPGHRRQRRLPARTSGRPARRSRRSSTRRSRSEMFSRRLRRRLRRRRALAEPADARRATPSSGTPTRPTSASRRTSTACRPSPTPVDRHRGRPGARRARRLGHHRPHLAGRRDQGGPPGRAATSPSTASSRATSTPTARAAATTR